MASLRSYVDGLITPRAEVENVELKPGDQVVFRKKVGRSHLSVSELMCGTIATISNNETATVTLPRPFGRVLRATVPLNQLQPATGVYKRARVNVNPAFRQTYVGRV